MISKVDEGGTSPYQWDHFSDQPYPIRDTDYKRDLRIKSIPSILKVFLSSSIAFFPVLFKSLRLERVQLKEAQYGKVGLCVNLDKEPELSPELVKELGVKKLSLRIPLNDVGRIEEYLSFARQFKDAQWLFVLLQDRETIEDVALREDSLRKVFEVLSPLGVDFQIANAINRTKWGFHNIDEYFGFFKSAQTIRDEEFPELNLLGSSIIDFEIYALLRSLFHFKSASYDGIASLLYVDRRGAPENKQFIFDLIGKINFFWSALSFSPKTKNRMLITEVNWPIEHTKPYAPALDDVWVSEEDYASYLARFYWLAVANGRVECSYWHQLVAPGYGLIDNREGVRKRRAYYIFKDLCSRLEGVTVKGIESSKHAYEVECIDSQGKHFMALWALQNEFDFELFENDEVFDVTGARVECSESKLIVSAEPKYIYR